MPSLNRDIANSIGIAVENDTITATGELSGGGVTAYSSVDNLPTSGNDSGDQAFVSGNNRLYIWNGSGWYNIALINTNPSFDSTGTPEDNYDLATDQSVTTITLLATDPEGLNITYTATTDSDFDGLATVSQDSSVFTITPLSVDSATTASGTLTFKASDGVNVASAISTFTLVFQIDNSKFTKMLIKAAGNNGTNTAINDASTNNHTITVNNGPTNQSFTPHHPGGYSAYFDGTGDYLSIADDTSLDFGTGDWTIECWLHKTGSFKNYDCPWSKFVSSAGYWLHINSSGQIMIGNSGVSSATSTETIELNTWHHIAAVRSSGVIKVYLDGVATSISLSYSGNNDNSTPFLIGALNGYSRDFEGYISDFRVVKGTAVYTSNFTSPTERLTAITNTSLLACHLPYIGEGSSNGHSITVNGTPAIERVGPYDYASYSSNRHGASIYFDGTNDEMIVPAAAWDRDADYTVEAWVYATSYHYIAMSRDRRAADGIIFSINGDGNVLLGVGRDNVDAWDLNYTGSVDLRYQWAHLALTHDASEKRYKIYVNGVNIFNNTSSYHPGSLNSVVNIGCSDTMNDGTNYYGRGFIADHRIVNSIVYTSDFTPPTAPLSTISGTTLHTCNDTPNIFNASDGSYGITLAGNTKSSTAQTKYANASTYFDGTGDYLTTEFPALGTDDFTIEFWMRPDTINSAYKALMDTRTSNVNNPLVWIRTSNVIYLYSNSGDRIIGTTTLSTGTWYHVCLVRNHGISYLFLNGQLEGSGYADTNNYTASTLFLGQRYTATAYNYNGYIEDFRITKGLARYPFIPAKETLTTDDDTQFITGHASTITDGSGNNHSITVSGATASTFAPKVGMYSISFDGSNDYVRADTALDWDAGAGQNFTIDGWVYFDTIGTTFESIVGINKASGGANHLVFGADDPDGFIILWNGSAVQLTGVPSNTGEWYHFAIVYTGTVFKIFINGAFAFSSTDTTSTRLQDCTLLLGAEADASNAGTRGNYLDGYISNFRIRSGAQYTEDFTPPTEALTG